MSDLSPYVGRWVARVRGLVVGVGATAGEARNMAKQNRPKDRVELLYVSPELQVSLAAAQQPMIKAVLALANTPKTRAYLVGGSIRDLLLGAETHDLDFAIDGDGLALARRIADRLDGAFVALDRERKTGRVILKAGNTRYLDFASLRGADLLADLRDRDFTINAMALEQTSERGFRLIDPLGGSSDLANRVVRATSTSSFVHDPVRTLRAVRMHAQFGCTIEPVTLSRLREAVPLLTRVSAERIRDEWFKILEQPTASQALPGLLDLGLLQIIAPPVADLAGLEQSPPHRLDVLAHAFETVHAVEQIWDALKERELTRPVYPHLPNVLRDRAPQIRQRYERLLCDERSHLALLKCAALLHDVGKAPSRETKRDGSIRFIGHERTGAHIARQLARSWHCSNAEADMLSTAVSAHMRPTWLAGQPSLTRRAIHRYFHESGEYGVDAAFVALADYLATWEPDLPPDGWRQQAETVARLWTAFFEQRDTLIDPPPLLSGRDLIEVGVPPGPRIGDLLARLREAQATEEVVTRAGALTRVQEWLAAEEP